MSRLNDVGGLQGFGAVPQDPDEKPFHADWEAHVFAMNRVLIKAGIYNLDEFRDAVENFPAQRYLSSSYFERRFFAIRTLCVAKGLLTAAEVDDALRAG